MAAKHRSVFFKLTSLVYASGNIALNTCWSLSCTWHIQSHVFQQSSLQELDLPVLMAHRFPSLNDTLVHCTVWCTYCWVTVHYKVHLWPASDCRYKPHTKQWLSWSYAWGRQLKELQFPVCPVTKLLEKSCMALNHIKGFKEDLWETPLHKLASGLNKEKTRWIEEPSPPGHYTLFW